MALTLFFVVVSILTVVGTLMGALVEFVVSVLSVVVTGFGLELWGSFSVVVELFVDVGGTSEI
jgi:hypothetical protein